MSFENSITIIGNMTRDAELRYTTGGVAVASFSLAYTPRINNNGKWEDGETSFFNCSAWRELGENVAASCVKGMRVVVIGRMVQRSWEDNDGNKRTSYDIQCDEVAPSLKWGTCEFEKVQRDTSDSRRSSNGGGRSSNSSRREPDPIYGDEEPF